MVALACATACAPPRPVALPELGTVTQRYRVAESARERLAAGLRGDLLVWARMRGEALPGVSGRLLIRAPDGLHVIVDSAFGVAMELSARAETLEAYVPSRRTGGRTVTDPAGLGVPPSMAAVRFLAGAWTPPGAAWDAATRSDSGWVVRWAEHADSLRLVVDGDGRPRMIEWRPALGDTLCVRYVSFVPLGGSSWPDRTEWSEARWGMSARVRLERLRPEAPPANERLRIRSSLAGPETLEEYADFERWWSELMRGDP
jgi:hypothetical protein